MITHQAAARALPCARYVAELLHARVCHTAPTGLERLPSEHLSALSVAEHVSLAVPITIMTDDLPISKQVQFQLSRKGCNNDDLLHESLMLRTMWLVMSGFVCTLFCG